MVSGDYSDMRDAIVGGAAQYILRGRLHAKRRPYSAAQVLAYVRNSMAVAGDAGCRIPETEADGIVAEATELADRQQDTNVNWDQWAFGR